MKNNKLSVSLMARIAIITALLCILAPITIPLPFSPVPLSLANMVIFLSVFVLNWKCATISIALYLLLGAVGLPVFSGFSGGLGKLFGPTGGYLVGYIPLVLIAGIVMYIGREKKHYLYYIVGVLAGEIVLYLLGTAWLAKSMSISFSQALTIAVIPYLPGDIIKIIVAMVVGQSVRRALTKSTGADPIS